MSEHMFGVGKGRLRAAVRNQIQEIARRHDCDFTNPTLPGDGPRYWFAGPNLGFPFDRKMEQSVWHDLEAVGLADAGGLVEKCFDKDEDDEDDR